MEGILNGFNTDDINVEDEVNVNLDPLGMKKEDFELLKIIQILQEKGILKKIIICDKCNKIMSLENKKNFIDKYCWR